MECRASSEHGNRNLAAIEQCPQRVDLTPELAGIEGTQKGHEGSCTRRVKDRHGCQQRKSKAHLDATPSWRGHQLNKSNDRDPEKEHLRQNVPIAPSIESQTQDCRGHDKQRKDARGGSAGYCNGPRSSLHRFFHVLPSSSQLASTESSPEWPIPHWGERPTTFGVALRAVLSPRWVSPDSVLRVP